MYYSTPRKGAGRATALVHPTNVAAMACDPSLCMPPACDPQHTLVVHPRTIGAALAKSDALPSTSMCGTQWGARWARSVAKTHTYANTKKSKLGGPRPNSTPSHTKHAPIIALPTRILLNLSRMRHTHRSFPSICLPAYTAPLGSDPEAALHV